MFSMEEEYQSSRLLSIFYMANQFLYVSPQVLTIYLNKRLFSLYPCAYNNSPGFFLFLPFLVLFQGQFVASREVEFSRMSSERIGLARREAVIRNKNASTGGIYAN